MTLWLHPRARLLATLIAMLAGGTLVLQYGLNVIERGRAPGAELVRLYGWFTIWSNSVVALVATNVGLTGRAQGLSHPAMLAASAVWIIVVGLVYNVLLAGLNHPPTPLRQAIDSIFHIIMPLAWPLWWLALRPAGQLAWRHLPLALPLPIAYCALSLWVGSATGRYPYFFIDVGQLGWGRVIINIFGLAALFTALMGLFIAWDRRRPA